jgi:hypothetical protein
MCSRHTFPDPFNFCPYCGSKLVNVHSKEGLGTKNAEPYSKSKQGPKKVSLTEFSELHGLRGEA